MRCDPDKRPSHGRTCGREGYRDSVTAPARHDRETQDVFVVTEFSSHISLPTSSFKAASQKSESLRSDSQSILLNRKHLQLPSALCTSSTMAVLKFILLSFLLVFTVSANISCPEAGYHIPACCWPTSQDQNTWHCKLPPRVLLFHLAGL